MSELNIWSIGVLVGAGVIGIAKLIGNACGAVTQYQPKNEYLATLERETHLQSLYTKNFGTFEDKYLSSNRVETFAKADDVLHRTQLKAIHTLSMFESLLQIEPMAYVAETKYGKNWDKIGSTIAKIRSQLEAPEFSVQEMDHLAENGESLIRKMTNNAHSLLAGVEEELMLSTVTDSMNSLTYKIITDGKSLIAFKGSAVIRASTGQGRLKLDTTSLPGISCLAETQEIEKELKKRGLVLQRLCENAMKLRKGNVKLKDPFPACPVDRLDNTEKKQIQVGQNDATKVMNDGYVNKSNRLVQRYRQQMSHNLIKEKKG